MIGQTLTGWLGLCPRLLAQGRLIDLGSEFREQRGTGEMQQFTCFVLGLAVVILAVSLASRYFNRRETRGYYSRRSLFRELCRAHRLGWNDRRLLAAVARWHRLPHPVFVFTEPQKLEAARSEAAFERRREQIDALARRLFAEASKDAG